MSYYHNSYYRRPLYKPALKTVNSFDIYEYLRKEFFKADSETFRQIARFYQANYGEKAYSYMLNTYALWKNGKVSISTLTMGRIIECVPKFLSPEKRLYILRCEIHNFIEKAKLKLPFIDQKISNLHYIFETLQSEIVNFNQSNLQWFIGKDIFPSEHVEYYLNVCKYTINERLIQSYKQSNKDLCLIFDKFNTFSYKVDSALYKVDFLNITFDIIAIKKIDIDYVPLNSLTLNLVNTFAKFGEQYILEELMKMSFYEKGGEINSSLKSKDIDMVFSQFYDMTRSSTEITMTSKFQGEGGLLTIKLSFVPSRKSVESILFSFIKIIVLVFSLFLITYLIIKFKHYFIFASFLIIGFSFNLHTLITKEITNIRKSIIQINRNGKQ